MKYTSIILTSLLLLGVCSGRHLDFEQSKSQEDSTQESKNASKTDDIMKAAVNDYKRERFNLPFLEDIKDTVSHKLGDIYQKFNDQENYETYTVEDLPSFTEPLDVGSVIDSIGIASIKYQNAKIDGLRNIDKVTIKVYPVSKKAEISLSMSNLELKGQYTASDLIRKTSGDFRIKLSGSVEFVQTYHYEIKNGQVQVYHDKGELKYSRADTHYENIGFFAQIIQGALGRIFLQSVNSKLEEEVSSKLSHKINQYIQNSVQDQPQNNNEKVLQDGLYYLVDKIQKEMNKVKATSINLFSEDREMTYKQLHAKISSVKLNGLDKLYLAENRVSVKDDQVSGRIQLAIRKPTATAIVSIHHARNEDAPFQKLNVNFNLDQVSAELIWDKQADLKLRSIQTSVNNIEPTSTDQYEGDVNTLIQTKLSSHVKHYIEDGLKNFIQNKVAAFRVQDVFPPMNLEKQREQE